MKKKLLAFCLILSRLIGYAQNCDQKFLDNINNIGLAMRESSLPVYEPCVNNMKTDYYEILSKQINMNLVFSENEGNIKNEIIKLRKDSTSTKQNLNTVNKRDKIDSINNQQKNINKALDDQYGKLHELLNSYKGTLISSFQNLIHLYKDIKDQDAKAKPYEDELKQLQ